MSKVKRFSLEERYGYQNRKVIYDKNSDNDIELNNIYPIIDLFNQFDKQIADLEAKLAESEKERELDNSFWKQECDGLQKALAEKTLTIEQINKAFIGNRSLWKGKYERANQDKISFAVEVLKIAQDYVQQYVNDFDDMNDCICAIDKLIKQLTHQHEDKGE